MEKKLEKVNRDKIQGEETSDRFQKLFVMLLDAIPSSVLLIGRDMRIISANRNFLEKSRRSIPDTIGCRLEEVFPTTILEHLNVFPRIHQVFEENRSIKGERLTYRAPGLPMRIYYYSIIPFAWNGVVENAMFLMEDVTEQVRLSKEIQRVERHLASVVESASDFVVSTDIEGRVLTWNTAAEKATGYTPPEVRNRFFFEYCIQEFQEEVKGVFPIIITNKNTHMAEWNLLTKTGGRISVSWVCSPMKDDLSQVIGIVAVGRDLTEHRKLEIQLIQSQRHAALGVMAGGIAHEIRNPLAISSSAAQFLMEKDISHDFRKECVEKIQAGIVRASMIIENLLRFARPSVASDIEDVNLVSLLTDTLMLVANQARINKIALISHFPEDAVLIKGRTSLLQQVFINLFLNAINVMPDGGILTSTVEKMAREVLVIVADTGCGISKEAMNKIFDPFYTTSPVGKGTGLGLSICYSIVKEHSGTIEVDSVPGKGSTFIVKLPAL